jgi:hypothetical protein
MSYSVDPSRCVNIPSILSYRVALVNEMKSRKRGVSVCVLRNFQKRFPCEEKKFFLAMSIYPNVDNHDKFRQKTNTVCKTRGRSGV